MVTEGFPIRMCCRVLEVSESGFYVWRNRPPSARLVRRAWLTDAIAAVHAASHGIYGSPRVHAELRLGRGIIVGHGMVETLMRHAGLRVLPFSRHRRPVHQTPTALDLVDRNFGRTGPDQLWVRRHHRVPHP